MRNNKGFSLVELIVVIAIMAILAAVAIPTFATFIGKAQQASDIDFMNQVESAVELAYATAPESFDKIVVTYANKAPTKVELKKGNDVVATIEASDKNGGSGVSAQEQDAALVIDWNYTFQAAEDKVEANDNWSSAWDLVSGN